MSAPRCAVCGGTLGEASPSSERGASCPSCGAELPDSESRPGYATQYKEVLDNAARVASGGGATTLFQPSLMAESLEETGDQPVSAYLRIVGAQGSEQIELSGKRTTFGRDQADVDLGDPTVSALHFRIDVEGREFFVRDLASRNGTYLNGHRVRSSELLPGDQLRAGSTILIFSD